MYQRLSLSNLLGVYQSGFQFPCVLCTGKRKETKQGHTVHSLEYANRGAWRPVSWRLGSLLELGWNIKEESCETLWFISCICHTSLYISIHTHTSTAYVLTHVFLAAQQASSHWLRHGRSVTFALLMILHQGETKAILNFATKSRVHS